MTYACDTLSRQLLDINQERQNPRFLHGNLFDYIYYLFAAVFKCFFNYK